MSLLESLVEISKALSHAPDEDDCHACQVFDRLQGAALDVMNERDKLKDAVFAALDDVLSDEMMPAHKVDILRQAIQGRSIF